MSNEITGLYPFLRYDDANAAIDFLVEAFGFAKHLVVPGEGGTVAHAQLTLGSHMVLLASTRDDDPMGMRSPKAAGCSTQGVYIVVSDIDSHHATASAAGAEIVMEPTDLDYGSRDYIARDPEGHVWSFGTFDPRA